MADLLSTIKQASVAAMTAANPAAILFGVVSSADPLEVIVDQRFTLPADFLILLECLTHYEVDLQHKHTSSSGDTGEALTEKIVIREGLRSGDTVLLLRVQGGQQYVILDRVVSG